ncbi:GLPGLI family protein [Tamlana sp. 2_MG-2023]|uniref:GLPGLI family protein n=1 Tax=unclassified Tamlana TaxID=2614803 RepID=UPI0026E22FE6|nr:MULTISPECIES: GLPGLI family protein [unclassified Tamlana]MDO6759126.1 GLPGLI family protein [Tamlana sp. 2_MG-2023]MDO6789825.1 GLPGLI family protein [Tamlana sp. 1_MG-2023]
MIFKILRPKMALLFLAVSSPIFAQKDFQGKAYYESKTSIDMSNFGGRGMNEERKKEIAARMKSALEKTFILTFNQSESIYEEEERLDAPGDSRSMRFGMMAGSGGDQYKNIKTQQISQTQDLFGKQFLIKDSLQNLDWKITGETKTIGKYMCFKAEAIKPKTGIDFRDFRRPPRDDEKPKDSINAKKENQKEPVQEILVTAWYTPQIPVNLGPDVYWGLPGLILEISADNTTILCSKIVINPSEKSKIKEPTKGKEVTQTEFDEISKAKMEEMREMRGGRGGRGGGGRR